MSMIRQAQKQTLRKKTAKSGKLLSSENTKITRFYLKNSRQLKFNFGYELRQIQCGKVDLVAESQAKVSRKQ